MLQPVDIPALPGLLNRDVGQRRRRRRIVPTLLAKGKPPSHRLAELPRFCRSGAGPSRDPR